jgi:cell division protein FtsN
VSSNYRPNPGKKTSAMSPMITGIVIGLILGVFLALGFAIWLNRHATPFVEKSKSVELLPTRPARPDTPKGDAMQPAPATAANEIAKPGGDKPRFEFYQTLPGDKDGTKGSRPSKVVEPKTAAKADSATTAAPTPNATTSDANKDAAKPPAKESYALQAGAFQSESDAENLKAKIAFAGMEATVRSVNLPDKGTLYRVRLGPYRSLDEVNRIKAVLSQNGISAAVVKPE